MAFDVDCVIIGAGVVGLAIARALSIAGYDVLVLEQEDQFGLHTSSHNSEVIHAGLYYPDGSLKNKFCVEGRLKLYEYCEKFNVPHAKIGKLIVASTVEEICKLSSIEKNAAAAGNISLEALTGQRVRAIEPALNCVEALFSRETGIIDSHQYMLSLLGQLKDSGGELALKTRLKTIDVIKDGYSLEVDTGGGDFFKITTRSFVNAAGLFAWQVADKFYNKIGKILPARYLAKGSYFSYARKSPFNHLIYPVPVDGGLGVHVTIDLAGGLRFGPDVEWTDDIDYAPNAARKENFVSAIKRYYPALVSDDLYPGFAGIRPKTAPPGKESDFVIQAAAPDGVSNSIHLFGIESPGLTSSLAIADYVLGELQI